jgi:hypothetical protein
MVRHSTAIVKSTRHSRIIGQFGEMLVVNWLSRSGFEVALVDHTGIDVIARDPRLKCRLGISVKSRTRLRGQESSSVSLFSYGGKRDEQKRKLMLDACDAFGCIPWLAIYVECENQADLYMTSLKNYDSKYRRKSRTVETWSMSKDYRRRYEQDPDIRHIRINLDSAKWFKAKAHRSSDG